MYRFFKICIYFTLPVLTLLAAAFLYNRATDGFNISQIAPCFSHEMPHKLGPSVVEYREKWDQSFRYLGKGCQCYAFESADGEFVIKFFKRKHLQLNLLHQIFLPRSWKERKQEERRKRAEEMMASCTLAYQELPSETGILFLHFHNTSFLQKWITLIDKLGFAHQIYLDDCAFLLQRRATPLAEALVQVKEEGEIREKIELIVNALSARIEKGVGDKDPALVQNMALSLSGKQMVFVDVGQFYKEENVKKEEEIKRELIQRLENFRSWAEEHAPQFVTYIDEKVTSF